MDVSCLDIVREIIAVDKSTVIRRILDLTEERTCSPFVAIMATEAMRTKSIGHRKAH